MNAWGSAWGSAWGNAWGVIDDAAPMSHQELRGPDDRTRHPDDDELLQIALGLILSGALECL